ncbi:MAG TPA: hypothetical protein VFA79_01590 [Myxococcales bacterium]|nr:hypothetical protein [Myxococcales bacterium]
MKIATGLIALALGLASAGRTDPIAPEVTAPGARMPGTSIGISLGVGGGVTNYTGSEMSNAAGVGGAYELRATIGTRLFLAGEVAYIGSRRNIDTSNVNGVFGGSPHIFSNGLEGALRVQVPMYAGAWMIEPFAFGGLGWTHFGTDEVISSSELKSSDDVLVVPFGGGISAAWNGLFLEGRFTYRPVFNEDLMVRAGNTASLNNWSAGALVGYEF